MNDDSHARTWRSGEHTTHLTVRVAGAVLLAVLTGVVTRWGLAPLVTDSGFIGSMFALLAACGVGTLLTRRAIAPVTRSRDELEVAYQEAVAEALQDPLTKLGNHRAFQEELDRQVEASLRYQTPAALVLIDLDGFKAVNDSHGHAEGDRVLARFGRLLELSARRPDRAFRTGGDEFAILMPHTDAVTACQAARRLLVTALQPVLRELGEEPMSFSAGVSSVPALAADRESLYLQADAALYAAKRAGRTEVRGFEPGMLEGAPAVPAAHLAAIADVVRQRLLRPVYQPIVDLATNAVIGYEGLIRPADGTPFDGPPDLFAAAEATGHHLELDLACLETIVAGAAALPPPGFLCVNLSAPTVESAEFGTAALLTILARHGLAPERIVLELTEHRPLRDPEAVRAKVDAFRRHGFRFAADDLGAGNAGLRLLSQVRFDVLKVDLSLVQGSAPGAPSNAVIASVVGLAAQTDALVVAEGLEHADQLAHVRALGVAAGQGYLLGRPGPLPAFPPPSGRGVVPMRIPGGVEDLVGVAAWRQSIGLSANA